MTAVYKGAFYVRWEGHRTRTDGGWLGEMMDIIYSNNLKPTVDKISNLGELSAALTSQWPANPADGRYLSGNVPGGTLSFKIVSPVMHDKVELVNGSRQRRLSDILDDFNYAIILGPVEPVDDWAEAGGSNSKVTIKAQFELFGDRGSLEVKN